MNCPFRYLDGAVIFFVIGDLPLEEKLVSLDVDLIEHIHGNRPILFVTSNLIKLDLVFTSG